MDTTNNIDIFRISSNDSIYEIFKSTIIGTSSYSVIYLGRCICSKHEKITRSDKLVAIKKINFKNLTQSTTRMVLTEIKIIKELIIEGHPNIVEYYEVVDYQDVTYVVMEYCDGGDMSSLLIGKQFKDVYLKYYFSQILAAINFLRKKKIIHCDMKPKNILLSSDKKTLKLCDFGFARHIAQSKRTNTVCGSPLYMAPELYKNDNYTESVDVWALGIILFEMVFGAHPFAKYNDIESLSQSIMQDDVILGENIEVSKNCLNLIQLMLKKRDSERITINDLFDHTWVKDECNFDQQFFFNIDQQQDLYSPSHTPSSIASVNESELMFEFDTSNEL